MDFTKLQGTGNDYIYMNAFEQEKDWAEVARKVSDRHFGIGADGLIIATNSSLADVRMRMFNADGSEGEMCGNGIRCFAKYVLESDLVQVHERPLEIETGAGVLKVIPLKDGSIINGANLIINEYGHPLFADYFFFITGFHGFHVFSGVVILIVILINVIKGTYEKRGHYEMVEKVGLYWHFVDLVWVFVFTFFYLV